MVDTIHLVKHRGIVIAISLGLSLLLPGCFTVPAPKRDIGSKELTAKIPAIKAKARQKDSQAIAQLVEDLDSEDSAVRFYAIHALRDLTEEDFGYKYYDDELERRPALEKWRDWLGEQRASGALSDK